MVQKCHAPLVQPEYPAVTAVKSAPTRTRRPIMRTRRDMTLSRRFRLVNCFAILLPSVARALSRTEGSVCFRLNTQAIPNAYLTDSGLGTEAKSRSEAS